jgi:hypothetical protein
VADSHGRDGCIHLWQLAGGQDDTPADADTHAAARADSYLFGGPVASAAASHGVRGPLKLATLCVGYGNFCRMSVLLPRPAPAAPGRRTAAEVASVAPVVIAATSLDGTEVELWQPPPIGSHYGQGFGGEFDADPDRRGDGRAGHGGRPAAARAASGTAAARFGRCIASVGVPDAYVRAHLRDPLPGGRSRGGAAGAGARASDAAADLLDAHGNVAGGGSSVLDELAGKTGG